MKKLRTIAIFIIVAMLLVMLMPATNVFAASGEVNNSGLFGLSGDGAYIAKDQICTYVKLGATTTLVPLSRDMATGTYFQEGELIEDAYIEGISHYSGTSSDEPGYVISENKRQITFDIAGEYGMSVKFSTDKHINIPVYALTEKEWNDKFTPTLSDPTTEEIIAKIDNDVDMIITNSTTTAIDSQVFKTLETKLNATLSINVGNITWKFTSSDITKTNSMFAPGAQISTEKFEYIKPNDITDGLFIEFAHDGALPGKAKVTIYVGTDKYGEGKKDLNLYYYNDITAKYEEMGTAEYNNGNITLSLDHCSTYAVTDKTLETTETAETTNPTEEPNKENTETTKIEDEKDDTPKTGISDVYTIIASLLLITSAGAIVLMKK